MSNLPIEDLATNNRAASRGAQKKRDKVFSQNEFKAIEVLLGGTHDWTGLGGLPRGMSKTAEGADLVSERSTTRKTIQGRLTK